MRSRTVLPPPSTDKITLDGQSITYTVKTSPRAKYVRLEIRPGSGLTVVIPRRYKIEKARSFVKDKRRWILEKLAKYDLATSNSAKVMVSNGDTLPYLGRDVKIVVQRGDGESETVTLCNGKLIVSLPHHRDGFRLALEQWYRARAETVIRGKVSKLAIEQQVTYNRIVLRAQKTLWGSCSRKRNLSFNWRLMMAPEPVVDYVIAHELAHLSEMNHSKKFWRIVAEYCPDWREHRKWLREHSAELAARLR